MWILVIVTEYYPSVYHFKSEEEARKAFDEYDNYAAIKHLAYVEKTEYNEEDYEEIGLEFDKEDVKTWDVEWK